MNKPSPIVRDEWVYLNGKRVPLGDARISISDAGLNCGIGFFETFRTSGGQPHLWRYHHDRIARSCVQAGIEIPVTFLVSDENALRQVIGDGLEESGKIDAVFRYTVTAGDSQGPTEMMTMRSLPDAMDQKNISLRVLKVRRDSGEWIPRPKSVNYLNAMAGLNELKSRKVAPADEGLFLSREGDRVVETPRQNVAWIANGQIFVVDESLGPVAGTCQAWMRSLDFPVDSARATLAEFLRADAIVCMNSVRGFTPVAEVWDEHDAHCLVRLDSGHHPIVRQLRQDWENALTKTARS